MRRAAPAPPSPASAQVRRACARLPQSLHHHHHHNRGRSLIKPRMTATPTAAATNTEPPELAAARRDCAAVGWTDEAPNTALPSPAALAALPPVAFAVGAQALTLRSARDALARVGSVIAPAATRDSDHEGRFTANALPGHPPATLHTRTLSAPAGPLDWAHQTFVTGAFGAYTKSSFFLRSPGGGGVDGSSGGGGAGGALAAAAPPLTPHLQLEVLTRPQPGAPVLLYLSMEPRLSLQLWPGYLDRYYAAAPPPVPPVAAASAAAPGSAPTAAAAAAPPPPPPLPSWTELERECAGRAGFARFVSPSPHVRAFCATGILFDVADGPEGRAAIVDAIARGVAIWGAWLWADFGGGGGGGANGATGEWLFEGAPFGEGATAAAAVAGARAHDAAVRRFPRREPSAPALKAAYGDAAVEAWWASMGGGNRL